MEGQWGRPVIGGLGRSSHMERVNMVVGVVVVQWSWQVLGDLRKASRGEWSRLIVGQWKWPITGCMGRSSCMVWLSLGVDGRCSNNRTS